MKEKLDSDELQDSFEIYGINISEEGIELCECYSLSGEQFAILWISYAASKTFEEINLERLESFEKEVLSKKVKFSKELSPLEEDPLSTSKVTLSTADDDDDLLAAYGASPAVLSTKKNDKPLESPGGTGVTRSYAQSVSLPDELDPNTSLAPSLTQSPSTQDAFSQRTNSEAVVSSFGPSLSEADWKADFSHIPEVKILPCGGDKSLSGAYNFMFEKLGDCSDILDDAIYYIGNQIKETLDVDELSHVHSAGNIVGIKGINPSGNCLIAEEVNIGKVLPLPNTTFKLGSDSLQIRVSCGPFTTVENLHFKPLKEYLKDVISNPPHVLFLMGPIVDSSHPLLEGLHDSYDSILERCLNIIEAAIKNTQIKVYIQISQKDVCAIPIYPTPPVFLSNPSLTSNVCLLPDPCLLDVDGITFGLTTFDLPMQISREEINFGYGSDRLGRFSKHLLLQQSFYPIYPPPENVFINLEQSDLYTRLPFTPHVIITPSDLKGFVKDVEGCLFINPERLAKGKIGGSHCRIKAKLSFGNLQLNVSINKI
ncbi:DNA polymerase alpha subunit B [Armadillidium nasatum]|uniref:DNA polymerase alpha subunit B n=1 Tax=Armadillidium nasatum TaxID=96803 RepID=A0A5N5T4U9_9CRUS|nr:DNA polymerase alpha subunit B [Armadillidium nasatum]